MKRLIRKKVQASGKFPVKFLRNSGCPRSSIRLSIFWGNHGPKHLPTQQWSGKPTIVPAKGNQPTIFMIGIGLRISWWRSSASGPLLEMGRGPCWRCCQSCTRRAIFSFRWIGSFINSVSKLLVVCVIVTSTYYQDTTNTTNNPYSDQIVLYCIVLQR